MDNHTSTSRAEAERLLGLAERLLTNQDLSGSKHFAILAQEAEPLLEGSDQIMAIIEVLSASQTRLNNQPNWYNILQVDPKVNDFEFMKKQYRRLALLLHPDKNKFAFAESAFHLVADAWSVVSDPVKKSGFDNELGLNFTKIDLEQSRIRNQNEIQNAAGDNFPMRRDTNSSGIGGGSYSSTPKKRGRPKGSVGKGPRKVGGSYSSTPKKRGRPKGSVGKVGGQRELTIWTGCPYCYSLFEYPRKYEGCCMRCVKCKKGFTAEGVGFEPPVVPGKEEYYCGWGMFPMGFTAAPGMPKKKRGRPRKNPLP
ncbi:chaperone [Lithospermum erythrorhizon]|uniref:Chaperone n=1 Tax=Lithospermum erythrorhizon TaxID=34254 RepID=A0AAV3PV61_LITER